MSLAVDSALWVDTLSTVTEFSIGLAGFSSVAAALMQRSGSILEFDRMRITTNICLSLVPGFLAFLAISLVHSGIDGSTIIRCVAGAIVVAIVSMVSLAPRINRQASAGQGFNPFAIGIAFTGFAINLPLQLYVMIVLPDGAFGLIVAGLTLILLTGSANFAGLVWQMLGYGESQTEA